MLADAFDGPNPSFAATLSEGTVALMHACVKGSGENDNTSTLSWGIAQEANQLLMSYPCIGTGQVAMTRKSVATGTCAKYVVCCLRGGTVYFIPVMEEQSTAAGQTTDIVVFSCPDADPESSVTLKYVQGFAAGNIRGQESTPVFIYCWAGGIFDVYTAGLLESDPVEDEIQPILRELATNSTVQLLVDNLISMNETDKLLEQDAWRKAREECIATEQMADIDSIMEDILNPTSTKYTALRSLLLDLSREY